MQFDLENYNFKCVFYLFRPYGKEFPRKEYWDFNEQLMIECNGRPHWAKTFSLKKDYFARVYPKFGDFNELRKKIDRDNMFINEFLEPIFM
jgi:L-gulonolactone oxidase